MANSEGKRNSSTRGFLHLLQARWGVDNIVQVGLILLVFSLAGMSVVLLRKSFFSWLGFDDATAGWLKTLVYLIFIFPSYQLLLLIYGALLGQFRFFWEKEKKLARWIGNKISGK
jgi:hypothetical protein